MSDRGRLAARWLLAALLSTSVHAQPSGEPEAVAGDPPLLRPGSAGVALTVLEGDEILEIPLTYLGTYENFGGPGYDIHLVELEGPEAEEVGVAAGMSGSPVYIDGRLIGALAYRLGLMPKKPIAGVTPLSNMRAVSRADGHPQTAGSAGFVPIATPVLVGGMPSAVREWLAPEMEQMGFVLVAGGGTASGDREVAPLSPGSPVGVELVRGDLRIAATGTVTFIEDDRVFAFGHPFFGTGRVEMPMVSARVIHTLADTAGSLKLASVGEELGAIVEDRAGAVVGLLGHRAPMIPLDVVVRGADYGDESYHYETIRHPRLAPLLAASVVGSSLRGVGYTAETTMLARGVVHLDGFADLPLEMAFASGGGLDPSTSIATEMLFVLSNLTLNPFDELRIESIELEIEARLNPTRYLVEEVQYDRGTVNAGAPLRLRCVLREYRGGTRIIELDVPIPDEIPLKNGLILAIGSPTYVQRALGDPLLARLRSAEDLGATVQALRERRAANHLSAAVYRAGGALVSHGEAYTELPPTAQRLLATQTGPQSAQQRPLGSPLGTAEVRLDGPVRGGAHIRLRVDRRNDAGGND